MQKKSAFHTYAGKIGGGIARGAITATLVTSLIPTGALAATTGSSSSSSYDLSRIPDNTYVGTAYIDAGEDGDFDPYTLTATVTVADHKITNIDVSQDGGRSNRSYVNNATNGVVPQIITNNSTANTDIVSGATYSSEGIIAAVDNALTGKDTEDPAPEPAPDPEPTTTVTNWVDLYNGLGVTDTSKGYDVVTSATNFTRPHVNDIPDTVHKVTDDSDAITGLDGVTVTGEAVSVYPVLKSITYDYTPSRGDGEFDIVPDDTVSGYTWSEYLNSIYAVTVSDGTTTVGAVPWLDWYGEKVTEGSHYNKLEVVLNNGISKDKRQTTTNIDRFAAFYDANGNVKAGTYTVTVYANGYGTLTGTTTVLPTYTGTVTADEVKASDTQLTLSNLPTDIAGATATVTYKPEDGDKVTVADGVNVVDGKVALDATQLATVPEGAELKVEVSSSNYATIEATTKVVAAEAPAEGLQVGDYVLVNIPYAQFYAAETGSNTTTVDVLTSATKSKTSSAVLAGSTYRNEDGSELTGVTFAVKVGDEAAAKALDAYTKVDSSDVLATAASYSYATLSEEPAVYKTVTADASGNLVFSAVSGEATAIDGTSAELDTNTVWGNYEIDFGSDVYNTVHADGAVIAGAVINTSDGSGYGLRPLANIWNASRGGLLEFAWSTLQDEVHGVQTNSAYYSSLMGKTITSITVYTDKGTYQINTGNVYVPMMAADQNVQAEDTQLADEGATTVKVTTNLSQFTNPTYTLDGQDVEVSADGTISVPEGTLPGTHTFVAKDSVGKYADVSASFVLSTTKDVATYDADNTKVVAVEGVSDSEFANYVGNISSVTVNGTTYKTGRRGTTIVKSDGNLDLDVESSGSKVFDGDGVYTVEVASTGYKTLTFEVTIDTVTPWTDIYADKGVDTSAATYDVVTSATNFTSRHASDIATIVNKATDEAGTTTLTGVKLSGKETTVTPKLSSATYNYSCNYGDGEFIIVPDDTVDGYTWNDFFDNAYAVTVSDGTTTVGALPWQDWYGEHATEGYHYNKFEVALNNGTSKGSNEGNVDRYTAFYDENGNVKAGTYTVTIYSEGYEPLVASGITVKPTPATAISASAVSYTSTSLTISDLPEDIQNAKATVSYTTGRGRNAKTTTVANAVDVAADGTVVLDTEQLKTLPDGVQLAVTVTSDNYADLATTADYSVGYVYGYSGLTWGEYYAAEPVDNATNVASNSQLDSHGESDLGGFDVVTRATTNHGLHRGSFQCTAVIETESGKTYNLASWNGRSEFVDTDGNTHSYSGGVIDGTDKVTGYEVQGLKYVPVAVRADQLDAYKATHTFIENGSTLVGGFSENSIQAYTATANVDENTNGLKTVAIDADGNVSYSAAKRDGTTSGIEGQDLQTIDLASLDPNLLSGSAVGTYGESIRIDLAGEGYGALGAKLQSVTWTYYGSDSTYTTPEATYGTKFAADNWMHRMNGIQLGLSDSYRSPISSLSNGGVGYWKITTHALGYADASYTFQVTSDNLAVHTLATDEDKEALQALVDQADTLTEQDYTAATWSTLQTELQETKDLLAKDTLYQAEATEQQDHLQSAIDGLEKRPVTTWRDDYAAVDSSVDTSSAEYDVVTSATNFTGRHAKDIAAIVSKATDAEGNTAGLDGVKLSGKEATVTPEVSSASYSYNCNYGDGEFIIVPDDTVEGYTWNDFFNNAYAVTVSDGTTTVAALPWQDWYGENSTSGYHYNKFEVALNNGTSKGSNEGQISRYAAFYDENGNVKAGTYTVTIYSEGYEPLVASGIEVLPTYTGVVSASDVTPAGASTAITGLPDDITNAKATVTYTVGSGRNATTTTLADGVAVTSDGTVALDRDQLATLPTGIDLAVSVSSDNYAPISTSAHYAADKSQLNDLIEQAQNLNKDDYTTDSYQKYEADAALDPATTVAANDAATQDEVDTAAQNLKTALDKLVKRATEEAKNSLAAALSNDDIVNELVEAHYTPSTWKAYQDALEAAKAVQAKVESDPANVTDQEVADAASALKAAKDGLVERADKTNLNIQISKADDLKEADYTSDSWKAYQDALKAAKAARDDDDTDQSAADDATKALKDAQDSLVKKSNDSSNGGSTSTKDSGSGSKSTGSSSTSSSNKAGSSSSTASTPKTGDPASIAGGVAGVGAGIAAIGAFLRRRFRKKD